jgi:ABC-2 type transport system ATP-binding protein
VRPLIGIVFGGERGLYWNLTGRQNLEHWAALYRVPPRETQRRAATLLERVGLDHRADDLVETYSRGMKQRLHLARALIGNARVLFLDEPTTGMDPVAARDFRDLVRELRSEGRTVLLTTHDMAEAEAVCDRVTLIDHGRVLAVESPQSLSRLLSAHERIDFEREQDDLVTTLTSMPGVASVTVLAERRAYRIELSAAGATSRVLGLLVSSGVTSIRTSRPSLEEVYLRMIDSKGLGSDGSP